MKGTIVMLGVIFSFVITWLFIATFVYLLSDNTFKQSMINDIVIATMVFLGWIPSVVVGADLNDKL